MLIVPDNLIYAPCIPPSMYPIYIKQSRFCILYPPACSHHPVSHIHQQIPITHWWNNAPICLYVYTSTRVALIMPWKIDYLRIIFHGQIGSTSDSILLDIVIVIVVIVIVIVVGRRCCCLKHEKRLVITAGWGRPAATQPWNISSAFVSTPI